MSQEWQIHNAKQTSWQSISALGNLRLNESVPKPTTVPRRSALVRMRAAALNARDFMVIAHDPIYPGQHMNDLVPCADGSGEVESAGPDSIWKRGDRVLINPNSWLDDTGEMMRVKDVHAKGADRDQGTLRQYAIWPDGHLIEAPTFLSFEELAALSSCGATAMNALFFGPQPFKPGTTVLAQGTGGVSCAVIQLAAAAGATVIATSSSDEKLEQAKEMGAASGINYTTTPDWAQEVLDITDGRGVDHVVDVVGAGTISSSVRATKQSGLISLVGFLSPTERFDLVPDIIFGGKTLRGVFNYNKPMVEAMLKLVEKHNVHPSIARIFEWGEARHAFEMLNHQSAVGKIVIRI